MFRVIIESGASDNPQMYGDLLLTAEQENILLNEAPQNSEEGQTQGFLIGAQLWPDGVVPYDGDRRLSKLEHTVLLYMYSRESARVYTMIC